MADVSNGTLSKVQKIDRDAPEFLKEMARSGEISIHRTEGMSDALKGADPAVLACVEKWHVTDAATIDILKRLHARGAETFMEVFDSGYVQPGDEEEAVSIAASSLAVQRALDLKAKIHKQMASDVKKQARQGTALSSEAWRLIEGDFRDVCRDLAPNSIDAIITDPPYPYEYVDLYGDLARIAADVLAPGGSLIAMCGQSYLPEIMALMTPHLTYRWSFAYMTPGSATQIFTRSINCSWKPVLWFVKGDYTGIWHGDVFNSQRGEKSHHEWQQSESGFEAFVERFSMPGQTILDPFCGAGTTGVCAVRQGRHFIGIDTDKSALESSAERLLQISAKSEV
jgi:site-specific DNA-methyltransferase (adenine-specific)